MRCLVRALLVVSATACSSASAVQSSDFPDAPYTTVASTAGDLVYQVRTAPSQPPTRGLVSMLLTVTDTSGAPLDGLTLDVVPWMPAMGHGASTTPSVTPEGGGKYLVNDLVLVMPGTWELRVSTVATATTVIPIAVE